jgi:hypothetical protein
MVKNGRRLTALAVLGIVSAAALAGCGGHTASGKADASALATSSAAAAAKANLKVISAKCGTTTAAGQIAAARDMTSHAGRQALLDKCGVPASKRSEVETKALDAAEHGHLVSGGHAARATYFEVTLPKIIEAAQA